MQFDTNTQRSQATIGGVTLSVIAPFTEGYTLSANEAHVMNQVLKENLRNNFAPTVAAAVEANGKAIEGLDTDALQAKLDEYTGGYEFGVRKSGGGAATKIVDPVERIARGLARDKVREAVKKKGIKVKDVSTEQMEGLISQMLEKYPQLRDEAKRQVKASSKIGNDELDLDLTGLSDGSNPEANGEGVE